ncbi:MAG TPA: hypothetical protein VGC67_16865 [Cellulomonas sp.]
MTTDNLTTSITTRRPATGSRLPEVRHLVRGGLATAAAAALALGAAGGAQAAGSQGSFDQGHVDGVHVALDAGLDQLVLGSNNESGVDPSAAPASHPNEYFPGSEVDAAAGTPLYDFTVDNESTAGVWTIPAVQAGYSGVWIGFAAAGEETPDAADGDVAGFDALSSYVGDTVTLTLTDVATDPGNTVGIAFAAGSGVTVVDPTPADAEGASYTVALAADDEAFHAHPTWTFTGAAGDTFDLTFVASTTAEGGTIADSEPITYRVTLG